VKFTKKIDHIQASEKHRANFICPPKLFLPLYGHEPTQQ